MSNSSSSASSSSSSASSSASEALTGKEIQSLLPLLTDWGALGLAGQIKQLNAMSLDLAFNKQGPISTLTREGEKIYPHVTYCSKISAFTNMTDSHSGGGWHTWESLGIQLDAQLSYEVTIGELRMGNSAGSSKEEKVQAAKRCLVLQHGVIGESLPYKEGQTLPEGVQMFHMEYPGSRFVAGPCLSKPGFEFTVGAIPTVEDTDITLIGPPKGATRAKVTVKIKGTWNATSEAEKFTANLTKLCVDKMPEIKDPSDLQKGGVLVYDDRDPTLSWPQLVREILEGGKAPVPFPNIISGKETQKGAPTAEPAAAFLKALTGKNVVREETLRKVNGKEIGWVVWDSDEFVEFRNKWNESSIHPAVLVRWVDSLLHPIFLKATGESPKAGDYYWFPCKEGGYYWFHRTEVRCELSPLTLETATQKECLGFKPQGSMFSELIQALGTLTRTAAGEEQDALGVLAKLLYATSGVARIAAGLVPRLWNVPEPSEVEGDTWLSPEGDNLNVFYPGHTTEFARIAEDDPLPVDPREMFEQMTERFGNCFVLCKQDEGSEAIIVSPWLANHLGTAPGGQLNLYAEVIYQLGLLLQSPFPPSEEVWGAEWRQWFASHKTSVAASMVGGETPREQGNSGMLAATARARGVRSAKAGGAIFSLCDVHGVRHTAVPGEMYVSTSNPLSTLDGFNTIVWRNPIPCLNVLTVKAVGPATTFCPNPSIHVKSQILSDSKVYLHPVQISANAGDIDGDGLQFLVIEELVRWATKPQNKEAVRSVPGLLEGLKKFFTHSKEWGDLKLQMVGGTNPHPWVDPVQSLFGGVDCYPDLVGYYSDESHKKGLHQRAVTWDEMLKCILGSTDLSTGVVDRTQWKGILKTEYPIEGSAYTVEALQTVASATKRHYGMVCVAGGFDWTARVMNMKPLLLDLGWWNEIPQGLREAWDIAGLMVIWVVYEAWGLGGLNPLAMEFHHIMREFQYTGEIDPKDLSDELRARLEGCPGPYAFLEGIWFELLGKEGIVPEWATSSEVFEVVYFLASCREMVRGMKSGEIYKDKETGVHLRSLTLDGLKPEESRALAAACELLRNGAKGKLDLTGSPEEPRGVRDYLASEDESDILVRLSSLPKTKMSVTSVTLTDQYTLVSEWVEGRQEAKRKANEPF